MNKVENPYIRPTEGGNSPNFIQIPCWTWIDVRCPTQGLLILVFPPIEYDYFFLFLSLKISSNILFRLESIFPLRSL